MSSILLLSRRDALKLIGLSAGALVLGGAQSLPKGESVSRLNVFVSIHDDDFVDIICHRSEMGQGIRTSVAMIIADELEVPWAKVRVVQGDGDKIYGDQNTDGSQSITNQYTLLREVGAAAREMLIAAATQTWKVAAADCKASDGIVTHVPTGKKARYGELAKLASQLEVPKKPKLKSPSEFKFIGKGAPPVDVVDITMGKAVYAMDIDLPGMLIASIERAPARGQKLLSFNDKKAKQIQGVRAVVALRAQPQSINTDEAVAVVATNTWAALKGREQLKIKWTKKRNSESREEVLKAALSKPGKVVRNDGDVALAEVKASHSAEFFTPYLAHAPMETPCATARVTSSGCELWGPFQDPQRIRETVARFLKISEESLAVHVTLIGGGFGRKSQSDFALEAVQLSKALNAPVKVVFSREDDIKYGFYHADSLQVLKAGLTESGFPITWEHKSAFPTLITVFDAKAKEHDDFELNFGASNLPYDIANVRVTGHCVESPVRVGWLRSVNNLYHAFAINVFIDELAAKANKDPVEYRLALLGKTRDLNNDALEKKATIKQNTGRMAELIRTVAAKAQWGKTLPSRVYQGFANHFSFLSYAAAVATIQVSEEGEVRVKQIDIGLDCGLVVNPDAVKAQLEGAVVFGMSCAQQKISLENARVTQSNFHDYPVLRMSECPDIRVHLTNSHEAPSGVGEPGVPPIAPAIANAIFAATKKPQRSLPLSLQS